MGFDIDEEIAYLATLPPLPPSDDPVGEIERLIREAVAADETAAGAEAAHLLNDDEA